MSTCTLCCLSSNHQSLSQTKRAWEWDRHPGSETESLGVRPRAWEWDRHPGNEIESLGMGPTSWEWDWEPGNGTESLGVRPRAWEWDRDPGSEAKILGMRLNNLTLWMMCSFNQFFIFVWGRLEKSGISPCTCYNPLLLARAGMAKIWSQGVSKLTLLGFPQQQWPQFTHTHWRLITNGTMN